MKESTFKLAPSGLEVKGSGTFVFYKSHYPINSPADHPFLPPYCNKLVTNATICFFSSGVAFLC